MISVSIVLRLLRKIKSINTKHTHRVTYTHREIQPHGHTYINTKMQCHNVVLFFQLLFIVFKI